MSRRRADARAAPDALSLMLVTDEGMLAGRRLDDVVAAAIAGGVRSVQLREKSASTRDFVELARELALRSAAWAVPLFVNDRVDVALAAGIANVHVGQSDLSPADVRQLMGPTATIGLSITRFEELVPADLAVVDYLGVGPIHPTDTKADAAPALGLDGLAAIRRATALPIVAIGGIGFGRVRDALAAGADGVAVVSAVMAACDPEAAARRLAAEIADFGRHARPWGPPTALNPG